MKTFSERQEKVMKKRVSIIVLVTMLMLSLSACGNSQLKVSDISVSEKGEVTASITPKKDLGEVTLRVMAKDSSGKMNFESEIPLAENFTKNSKTTFSFNLLDSKLWAGAKISYNPFGNMFQSFLEDSVSCELHAAGETIASFDIDTSKVDPQKALE